MPRRSRKKEPKPGHGDGPDLGEKVESPRDEEGPPAAPAPPGAAGLPAPGSIVGETEFTSPKGFKYRIIHTSEVDPSDEPKPPSHRRKGKKT